MNVVVTGGSGMIGRHVVAALVAGRHEIVSVDRAPAALPGARCHQADLRDADALPPLLRRCQAIVHLANHPNANRADPRTLLSENLSINVNVCQAAADAGVGKIVFASSIQAVADSLAEGPLPADGEAPARPDNVYGLSKALTEHMLAHYSRLHGLAAVAIRFPWVASQEHHLRQAAALPLTHARRKAELAAWLWVEDAASLVAAVLSGDLPGFRVYLPSAPLMPGLGTPESVAAIHYPDAPRRHPGKPLDCLIDNTRITRETGWVPRDLSTVLARLAAA